MDYNRIEYLLDKYWQCKTTLTEEEELRLFFCEEKDIPGHLQKVKEVFVYQAKERQIGLDEQFDRKIWLRIQERKSRKGEVLKGMMQFVAIILLFVMTHSVVIRQQIGEPVGQTPEQVLAEVREALGFIGAKLNRSREIVEKNLSEINTVTQYIKN